MVFGGNGFRGDESILGPAIRGCQVTEWFPHGHDRETPTGAKAERQASAPVTETGRYGRKSEEKFRDLIEEIALNQYAFPMLEPKSE